jgi:hypothetical protein
MTDDLVKRLRDWSEYDEGKINDTREEAADRIEALEAENTRLVAIIKEDNAFLAGYHKWCQMHGYAPSSSDLLIAIKALKEEKKNDELS